MIERSRLQSCGRWLRTVDRRSAASSTSSRTSLRGQHGRGPPAPPTGRRAPFALVFLLFFLVPLRADR